MSKDADEKDDWFFNSESSEPIFEVGGEERTEADSPSSSSESGISRWLSALAILLAAFYFYPGEKDTSESEPSLTQSSKGGAKKTSPDSEAASEGDKQTVFEKYSPAVALIETKDASGETLSQGSGFLVDRAGFVVTNLHVVSGDCSSVVVKFPDTAGTTAEGVVRLSEDFDLAVIKIPPQGLPRPCNLADSSRSAKEGDSIAVIGSPSGFSNTLSEGVISSIRGDSREILQITAPISPGSSGSPVFSANGKVVAVATASITDAQNLNFGVSVDCLHALLKSAGTSPPLTLFPLPQEGDNEFNTQYQTAINLLQGGDYSEAAKLFTALTLSKPEDSRAWANLGTSYHSLGRIEEAVEAMEKANALSPGEPVLLNNLGELRRQLGDFHQAERDLREAIRLDPTYPSPLTNLSLLLRNRDRHSEALPYLQKLIKLQPNDEGTWKGLATCYHRMSDYREAEKAYRAALKIDGEDSESWYGLGVSILKQSQNRGISDQDTIAKASQCFQKAVEFDPDNYRAQANLATMLLSQGQAQDAVAVARKALEINPNYDVGKQILSDALAALNASHSSQKTSTASASARPVPTYRVRGVARGDTLNVRRGPGIKSRVAFVLHPTSGGITILGDPVSVGKDRWYPIRWKTYQGYTNGKYLEHEPPEKRRAKRETSPAPTAPPIRQPRATHFTLGSSKSEVAAVMGTPTSVNDYESIKKSVWYYEYSSVGFKNGLVTEWSNTSKNLKVVLDPKTASGR